MVDEIINSAEAQNDAAKVAGIQRKNAMFGSISDTFKFAAGIFTAAAMALLLPAITTGAVLPPIGIAVFAAAVVSTAIAVGSQYFSSRGYQNATFNALEVNAKHTAKYLVKEIEGHNMCMTENKGRADGKTWCEYNAQRAAAEQQIVR